MSLKNKIVAISPLEDSGNSFVQSFAKSISDQGFLTIPFDWNNIGNGTADIAIIHWPYELLGIRDLKGLVRILWCYKQLWTARAAGTRFIWVAHNAEPHDMGRAATLLMKLFLLSIHGIVHLSSHSRRLIDDLYSPAARLKHVETVHGHYRAAMQTVPSIAEPVQKVVKLSYFGQIRRYKNVERLAELISAIDPESVSLSISGRSTDINTTNNIRHIASLSRNIELYIEDGPLGDLEIERNIDNSHASVLPYKKILNSGAAIFALSRNRPILAPNAGSLPEIQKIVGENWVQLYDGDLNMDEILKFTAWLRHDHARSEVDLSELNWDRVGANVAQLIGEIG